MREEDITPDMILPAVAERDEPRTLAEAIADLTDRRLTHVLIDNVHTLSDIIAGFMDNYQAGRQVTIGEVWAAWWVCQSRAIEDAWMRDEITTQASRNRRTRLKKKIFSDVATEVYERDHEARRC
jgi:hypothetical protein